MEQPEKSPKHNTHISVRFNEELAQRVLEAARQERRSVSDLVRNLIEWAMPHYEQHGPISELYRNIPVRAKRGVTPFRAA
jgi:hypothetical protein